MHCGLQCPMPRGLHCPLLCGMIDEGGGVDDIQTHLEDALDAGKQLQINVRLTQKLPLFAFGGAARAVSFLVGGRAEKKSFF